MVKAASPNGLLTTSPIVLFPESGMNHGYFVTLLSFQKK